MAVKLCKYLGIKDSCCISYHGACDEYVVQLRLLRPAIERSMPGVSVYLSCRDAAFRWLEGASRVFPESQYETMIARVAFRCDLAGDLRSHPVERLMDENAFPFEVPPAAAPAPGRRCLIVPVGVHPTRSLDDAGIRVASDLARSQGYSPEFGDDADVGWVVGVEGPLLFHAASRGVRTTLLPTGLGLSLYRRMFPAGEVARI